MDFFEKYADRYDIDLTGATTREEKIEIFAKERKYKSNIFCIRK